MTRRLLLAGFAFSVMSWVLSPPGHCAAASVREAEFAGRFYPEDAVRLRAAVEAFMESAVPPAGPRPLALIVPHAGYVFSGQIAADAYRQAAGHEYDAIVVLGTHHRVPAFGGISVYQDTGYRTPLGLVSTDDELTAALLAADPDITFRPGVHRGEHSVEVQLPFLQVAFPGVPVVVAVVGTVDPELTGRLGRRLAQVLGDRRVLIVASSDLSHYPSAPEARRVDAATLRAAATMDPAALSDTIDAQLRTSGVELSTCACGQGAMLCAMVAARAMGARHGAVVSYANSGDTVFGEPERVVGYGAVAYTVSGEDDSGTEAETADPRGPHGLGPVGQQPSLQTGPAGPSPPATADTLNAAERACLLQLARDTLTQYLESSTVPLPRPQSPALRRRQGVFVTLHKLGALRGCIGHMVEDTPLALLTARMALQAAFRDGRFRPVTLAELPQLEVEISVLTPFERVASPNEIVVGRDGVVLEKDGHRAVYLPQVAPEQGWTRIELLSHLCGKAGLNGHCWRTDAELFTFQAQVFGEASPH